MPTPDDYFSPCPFSTIDLFTCSSGVKLYLVNNDIVLPDMQTVDFSKPEHIEILNELAVKQKFILAAWRCSGLVVEMISKYHEAFEQIEKAVHDDNTDNWSKAHNLFQSLLRFSQYVADPNGTFASFLTLAKAQSVIPIDEICNQVQKVTPEFIHVVASNFELTDFYMFDSASFSRHKYKVPMPGYVYVFKLDDTQYKIGYSADPDRRIKELTSALPIELQEVCRFETNHMAAAEAYLHARYASKRNGKSEWFNLDADDLERIRCHKNLMFNWFSEEAELSAIYS